MYKRMIAITIVITMMLANSGRVVFAADLAKFDPALKTIEKVLLAADRRDKPQAIGIRGDRTAILKTFPKITDEMIKPVVSQYIKELKDKISALGELSPAEAEKVINQLEMVNSRCHFYWNENNTKVYLFSEFNFDFSWLEDEREKAAEQKSAAEFFSNTSSQPSAWSQPVIKKAIENGFIPEKFRNNYQKPITLEEYIELYSRGGNESIKELYEARNIKITISDNLINENSTEYAKFAFIFGLIDKPEELSKTMTREEAAIRFSKLINDSMEMATVNAASIDSASISPEAIDAVDIVLNRELMNTINGKFEPKSPYTVEQAIYDLYQENVYYYNCRFYRVRGFIELLELDDTNIVVGKNFIHFNFIDENAANRYFDYCIKNRIDISDGNIELFKLKPKSAFSGKSYTIPITGKYQKIDVGYMIIELNSSDYKVKYTFKNGLEYLSQSNSGTITFGKYNYYSQPRELKYDENINLEIQPDSLRKILNTKLDGILSKIIKNGMTQEQKVKAIHDYVVNNIKSIGGNDIFCPENALRAIEQGKGVCVHYTMLFYYLCDRAGIKARYIAGDSNTGGHGWNLVYLNGKWLHVDATYDDSGNKLSYNYFLKDADYMLKTRYFEGFGVTHYTYYNNIDPMKIRTSDELRAYLYQQVQKWNWPNTIKFRLANKNIDTNVNFLKYKFNAVYTVKYDAKQDLYIMTNAESYIK